VRDLRVVSPAFEVDVVQVDRGAHMGGGTHRHDPGGAPFPGALGQSVVERPCQSEVAQVIGRELELPGLLGPLQAGRDQAGVDQQVQARQRAITDLAWLNESWPAAD
jgi:hypothetical protein